MGRFYFEQIQGAAARIGRQHRDAREQLNALLELERSVVEVIDQVLDAAEVPAALATEVRAVLATGLQGASSDERETAEALLLSRLPMVERLARLWREQVQHVLTPLGYLGEHPAEWLALHQRNEGGGPEARAEVERRLLRQQADEARGHRPAWVVQARARWNEGRALPWVGPDGEAPCCACGYDAPTLAGRLLTHDTDQGQQCEGGGLTPAELRARLARRALRKEREEQRQRSTEHRPARAPRLRTAASGWLQTSLFAA